MSSFLSCLLILILLTLPAPATIIFRANLTPDQVVPQNGAPSPNGISNASGYALLYLDFNLGDPTLTYEIHLTNLNFLTDVTGVHIHRGHAPILGRSTLSLPSQKHRSPTATNGPHVLNIFGLPRQDDADLYIDPSGTFISGVWDNSDLNYGIDGNYDPSDSLPIRVGLEDLLLGDLYIQIHTNQFNVPNTGELRGPILPIPEPHSLLLTTLTTLPVLSLLRRR